MKTTITLRVLLLLLLLGALPSMAHKAMASPYEMPMEQKVSGKVTDEGGNTLPGVSVTLKGSTKGTTTDNSGAYSINVPDGNAVLVFSFIGYASKDVTVGTRSTIDIELAVDTKALEEVVVVGYGTQRKVDLTGAVTSVTSKDIVSRAYTNPDQILAGRATGVHIANRSGDPGAPIDVRIRGVGTTGNNQPLWVIDGVPIVQTTNITVNTASYSESSPLAGINPADIESMDILKDASAAAIYGARAANGVIIITTKRGKEGRTNATYDGYYGVQTVSQSRRNEVLGVSDYIALQKELGRDFSAMGSKPFYDWQDAVFQTGAVRNHNVTVSGGTKNLNFNIGGGYHGQDGVELGQDFKRLSFKANSDLKVGKYLRFGESILLSSTNRLIQSEGGEFAGFNSSKNAPYFAGYTDGSYTLENDANRGAGGTGNNYLWRDDTQYNETRVKSRKMLANVYGEVELISGLKYKFSLGADYNVADGFFFQEAVNYGGGDRSSLLVQERPIELTTNLTNTITYHKTIGKSDVTVLGGYEETSFRYDKIRVQGRSLFNTNIRFASVADPKSIGAANEADHWALRGWLGRVNYSFDNKYLFTFNVRRDETSRFSKDNRAGIFPSFSAGWRLSEESFLRDNKVFSDVKLRASWGQSGNQFTGSNFAYLPSLATTPFYVVGGIIARGPAPVIFANANLKWETSTQLDFGGDVTLYNGKVNVTFDYFQKLTKDVLLSQPIPLTSGYSLPADANLGEIKNTGFEFAVDYRNSVGKFKYSIGGNITTVKNEVVSLGSIAEIMSGVGGAQTHRTSVGQPIGYFYGYKTNGIYQSQSEIDADKTVDANSGGRKPGDIRFVDTNGDGKINADDRIKIGSSIPGFYYGINLSATYGRLDFSALLQGVGNVQVYNQARASLESMKSGDNQSSSVLNRWTTSNPSTTMPRATADDPNNNTRYSDRWIDNASYLRVKNIQIGYNLPASVLNKWTNDAIGNSRIYIGVQNFATITKYKGYDPEVTRGSSFQKGEFPLANGQNSGGSPQPTIVQFGWQVNF